MILVVALVIAFGSSSNLASAYGIAVSLTMLLETSLIIIVVMQLTNRARGLLAALLACIGFIELLFVASNATKVLDGGWFPLTCGLFLYILLSTWKRLSAVIAAREVAYSVPMEGFLQSLHSDSVHRVPGTAVYLTQDVTSVPATLLHNLKHNKVIHERMVFLTIATEDVPSVATSERTQVEVLERGEAWRVTLLYGFREDPDVPLGISLLRKRHGLTLEMEDTTFFLGKTTVARAEKAGLFTWRREIYRWMQRNSPNTVEYFKLPPSRVIELGTQISL
jgi:KUP system potassium uptake protein